MRLALLLFASYLLGSIPFSLWVAAWSARRDVRREGTGNVGATNVFRLAGFRAAALAGCLDALKGAIPAALVLWTDPGPVRAELAALAAGACAMIGHDFPLFLRFRGGKGGATALGALTPVFPVPMLCVAGTWGIAFGASSLWARGIRFGVSLASLVTLPAWVASRGAGPVVLIASAALPLLLFLRIGTAREDRGA